MSRPKTRRGRRWTPDCASVERVAPELRSVLTYLAAALAEPVSTEAGREQHFRALGGLEEHVRHALWLMTGDDESKTAAGEHLASLMKEAG